MTTHLASYFRQRRLERGLGLGRLAVLVGYKNTDRGQSKGANRLHRFETTGEIHQALLTKLADALGIDQATVQRLAAEDNREFLKEWAEWASTPIRPYIIIKAMPAVYCPVQIPDNITDVEEAKAFASDLAKTQNKQLCLVLSRKVSVWYRANGTIDQVTETLPGEPNTPFMRAPGERPFLLNTLEEGKTLQEIDWPKKSGPS